MGFQLIKLPKSHIIKGQELNQNEANRSFYFESHVSDEVANTYIGIGLASGSSAIIYHATAGEILTSDQRIALNKPYGANDIIGCLVTLNVYSAGNLKFHHCTFYLNGEMCCSPLYLEGCLPLSIVSLDITDTNDANSNQVFTLNMGDRAFRHTKGNCT